MKWCISREDPPPVAANTYAINQRFVASFCGMFGYVITREVRPQHFDEWLAAMKKPRVVGGRTVVWGKGTCRLALNVMKAAFAWASTAGGILRTNPFQLPGSQRLRLKRVRYKGKRLPITAEEHRLLVRQALRRAHKDFGYLLLFLWGTGARPAELYLAKASEWDEERSAFRIEASEENHGRFKLAHLGEPRVVYVPPRLVPLARLLMEKYPTGPIFRDQKGQPYNKQSVCGRMKSLRLALNQQERREAVRTAVTAYSYRHAYVTRWIEKGHDLMHLCELLNTSLQQLHRHYSHLFTQHQALRESLAQFDGEHT